MDINYFDTHFSAARVDAGKGVIYGVSVITANVKARGHELFTDSTTLEQMRDCGNELEQVPVKWNHRTGADAVNGYLTNFQIKKVGRKNKLLADWHLLKTHAQYEQALELAERMPRNVGLSAAFRGEDEVIDGKSFARCEELLAVDLVAHPAANPTGMFADPSVDNLPTGMDPKKTPDQEPTLRGLMARLEEISSEFQAVQDDTDNRLKNFENFTEAFLKALQEGMTDPGPDDDEGEEDPEKEPETPGKDDSELSSLAKSVRSLEARFRKKEQAEQEAEIEGELAALLGKFEVLLEENKSLKSKASAREHLLEARGIKFGGSEDNLSVSVEGADPGSESGNGRGGKGKSPTEFEAKVREFTDHAENGKKLSRAEAIRKTVKEFPELYHRHLEARGVRLKEL
ncbi:MAG: hypothetical protein LBH01_02090 [Verrucomicrobiales bacterium]|jgi:hypothetical protein|nr:hypothetical protein [Verrucomicrobiales bacterium]